ncbi:hypothetical protein D3C75_753160 [compost metagenome]
MGDRADVSHHVARGGATGRAGEALADKRLAVAHAEHRSLEHTRAARGVMQNGKGIVRQVAADWLATALGQQCGIGDVTAPLTQGHDQA